MTESKDSGAFPVSSNRAEGPSSLRVDFSIKVRGGDEMLVEFGTGFEFALGLEADFLASTDASFGEVFNRLVTQPVEIAVRRALQRRFEASSRPRDKGALADAKKLQANQPAPNC